ncbi:efflux RND transporter permease subunit [Alkaliphilus peptidifermentans]|uniref:Hydrophobic/amphiphilic exporter-1, HAE1 family n=1 Tax=Alkaliphilus peptidifermentans DSM 18978 TaxID=1120976 RepID=A0A1G5K2F1_9FIRM|nr:efflux RND transporter permease subunit [Alkaliphilus peptidifermentans]SCY94852.1 hydrophobic/amphiphilic exporter-1, HAE1 family [Alkaliphilus peptidifermentans DSM 18978]
MRIINWAVEKYVSVIMLMALIILMGSVSMFKLSLDLLPRMNVPVAVVNVQYPGAGPLEIENMVTKPLEEAVAMVHNVKRITSTSIEGSSSIIVEFNQGTNMEFATLEIREKIDLIKNYLPENVSSPMVLKIDPNALPIMLIGITGNYNLNELQQLSEIHIKPRLERLTGVAAVNLSGGVEDIIEIRVNSLALNNLGLDIRQLTGLIRGENINLPIGEIGDGKGTKLVRSIGEYNDLEEIKNLAIPSPTGTTVPLKEIAAITLLNNESMEIARLDGKPSIRITLQKQPVANTVKVANDVNSELEKLRDLLPGVTIEPIIDQSVYIKKAIGNVGKTAIYGGFLAVLVLFLFLRNGRSTMVIALAIPISILATFALMYFSNLTLNLLSLGGFALGIGMLVDNGIVVTENIHRFREEGNSSSEAAINGTKEVAMAVIASTFTTLAVFLPIVFVEGMTAEIFRELALTVAFALLASLLVSLTLVPMLASRMLNNRVAKNQNNETWFNKIFNGVIKKINSIYLKVLKWSISHRLIAVLLTLLFFLATISSLYFVGAEYFPEFDEGTFNIDIRLPQEATINDTVEIVNEIEGILRNNEEVESIFTNIGGGDIFHASKLRRKNRASIDGKLVSTPKRKDTTAEVVDKIRRNINSIAGAEIKISASSSVMSFGFGGAPVEVEIRGDDIETLQDISKDIVEIIEGVDGTREVSSNFQEGNQQLAVKVNRDIAARYGLQGIQVASTVKQLIEGSTATMLKNSGKEIKIIIMGEEFLRDSIENFVNIPISTPLGISIPLQQVAEFEMVKGPSTIRRRDQVRTVTINASILQRDLNSIIKDIQSKLESYSFPPGYSYQFRGQREQLEEAFSSLILVVILAILLVYMILASQFQSFLHPFTIMMSVPLAFSGGALGLFLTGRALSVPALIGVIVLAGIVVNNGIVLIDYINVLRKKGLEREKALIVAGETRLRPILMTSFTTILGVLPLALGLGEGAEAQAPMATVVIGGLFVSTLLTLVMIPVIYSLLDDLQVKFKVN